MSMKQKQKKKQRKVNQNILINIPIKRKIIGLCCC